jgi:hypothetical protein
MAKRRQAYLAFIDHNELILALEQWITQAVNADFFTVAVRTGGAGAGGVSIIMVERERPGVSVRRMKLQGNWYVLNPNCLLPKN